MVRRRAILIGNETGYRAPKFLSGVRKDLENYGTFLSSSVGGMWDVRTEIKILYNKNRAKIIEAINNCQADYSLIMFSGHGFWRKEDEFTYGCVDDNYVSEDELITSCDRQTLILDCCRQPMSIPQIRHFNDIGIGDAFEKAKKMKIINARKKFDQALSLSGEGIFSIYGCSYGQASGDTQFGGVLSSALLNTAKTYDVGLNNYAAVTIKGIFTQARKSVILNPFTNQSPQYSWEGDGKSHPFVVCNTKSDFIFS